MDFLNSFFNDTLLVSLSKTLLHFVWQGAALAFALFLLLKLVDKQYSRTRYLVSLFVLGLNVVVPVVTFLHFSQVPAAIEHTITTSAVISSQAAIIAGSTTVFDWQLLFPIIAISWLVGVCWLSTQLIYEVHKVNQLPRNGTSPVEQHIQDLFEHLTKQLKANPLTRLMVSTKADVPMVIGWLRPIVLVPTSMIVGLTPVQLEMLLAHELAHVKRHDYLINFFQTLVEVLFFFHPCVKWVSNQIRIEREYCCDDIAVGCCGSPTAYARALTNAELIRKENIPQLAMAATGGDLKKRVLRLIDQHDCSSKHSDSWASTVVAGFTGIGLVLIFVAAPHMATAELASDAQYNNHPLESDSVLSTLNANLEAEVESDSLAAFNEQSESLEPPLSFASSEVEVIEEAIDPSIEPVVEEAYTFNTVNRESAPSSIESIDIVEKEELSAVLPPVEETEEVVNQAQASKIVDESTKSHDVVNELVVALIDDNNQVIEKPVVNQISRLSKPLVEEVQKAQQRFEPVVVEPKIVRSFAPKYPEKAVKKDMEAEFSVTFTVNSKGKVVKLKFEEDVHKSFQRSVKLALKRWRFESGTINGEKQPMEVTRVFSFTDPGDSKLYYLTGSRLPKRRY